MADIVNLNKYRKARKRATASMHASENRVRYGRSANEKRRDADAATRIDKALDDGRLEAERDDPEPA